MKVRGALKRFGLVRLGVYGGLFAALGALVAYCTWMPGNSADKYRSEDADLTVAAALKKDVEGLVSLGERNLDAPRSYEAAQEFLAARLDEAAHQHAQKEEVKTSKGSAWNLYVEIPARARKPTTKPTREIVVVGAHYDTAPGTPGANDNGSGVAVALELARRLQENPADGRVRIVLFANEEPPHFWTNEMGSLVHAKNGAARHDEVKAMIALETMGYYSEEEGTQKYPPPVGVLYPSRGNFIAFVGNLQSRSLVVEALSTFRGAVEFPSEGAALPSGMPGAGWSDHWSFWQVGVPALMVTDTAPFRDVHYHQSSDAGSHIDYPRLSVVTDGVEAVIRRLASPTPQLRRPSGDQRTQKADKNFHGYFGNSGWAIRSRSERIQISCATHGVTGFPKYPSTLTPRGI